jgi:uncharacterized protein YjiS (DUF1127 family)
MIASIARRYLAWRQQVEMRRELYNLTDRDLADMGISRSDIPRIVSQVAQGSEDE